MTRLRLSLAAAAALAAVLGACDATTAPDPGTDDERWVREPSFLAGPGDSARVEIPDTVAVNAPVLVVVPTGGGGCTRQGDTEASVTGLTADVRPFDFYPVPTADIVCTADFRILRHEATLRFTQAGRATVRVHGRLGPDRPTVVTRSVVVR
jgi:hypothetical protein